MAKKKQAAPGVVGRCGDCKAFGPFKSFGGAKDYCMDCTVFNPLYGTENRFEHRKGASE